MVELSDETILLLTAMVSVDITLRLQAAFSEIIIDGVDDLRRLPTAGNYIVARRCRPSERSQH